MFGPFDINISHDSHFSMDYPHRSLIFSLSDHCITPKRESFRERTKHVPNSLSLTVLFPLPRCQLLCSNKRGCNRWCTAPSPIRWENERARASVAVYVSSLCCVSVNIVACVDIAFGFGRNFLQCLALFRRSRTLGQKLWRRRPAADFCFVHRKKEARETERSQWKISAILANCFDRFVSARMCVWQFVPNCTAGWQFAWVLVLNCCCFCASLVAYLEGAREI